MNKNYIYTAVGILVLALIGWGIYAYNHQGNDVSDNSQQAVVQNNQANQTNATTTPTSTPTTTKVLSYGDAIKAYPNRFQFLQCKGTPAVIAVKKGTAVMLDNRDTVAHTILADTQSFRIAGYSYAIFHPSVIGNLTVKCDGKNSVTLNVQK